MTHPSRRKEVRAGHGVRTAGGTAIRRGTPTLRHSLLATALLAALLDVASATTLAHGIIDPVNAKPHETTSTQTTTTGDSSTITTITRPTVTSREPFLTTQTTTEASSTTMQVTRPSTQTRVIGASGATTRTATQTTNTAREASRSPTATVANATTPRVTVTAESTASTPPNSTSIPSSTAPEADSTPASAPAQPTTAMPTATVTWTTPDTHTTEASDTVLGNNDAAVISSVVAVFVVLLFAGVVWVIRRQQIRESETVALYHGEYEDDGIPLTQLNGDEGLYEDSYTWNDPDAGRFIL
eukprot:m.18880 g.18880  ORF g.18880 m.18880 type:complete len:299 (-) comp5370_c0_seq1:61-957(-)